MRRAWTRALSLSLVAFWLLTLVVSAQSMNLMKNGSFEDGFGDDGVGVGWTSFNNGGEIAYGFRSDDWDPAVFDGAYSQLINMHTASVGGSQEDRYAGIFQVVNVVPDARYMFSVYGLVRSTEGTEQDSSYNYRVQIGYDYTGGTDPWAVTDWTEMDRWHEYPMDKPGRFDSYAHGVTATSDKLTIFIRVWKKFPTARESVVINLDAISLLGPAPAGAGAAAAADGAKGATLPQTGGGSLLPVIGLGLGLLGLGLTGMRVARSRS